MIKRLKELRQKATPAETGFDSKFFQPILQPDRETDMFIKIVYAGGKAEETIDCDWYTVNSHNKDHLTIKMQKGDDFHLSLPVDYTAAVFVMNDNGVTIDHVRMEP